MYKLLTMHFKLDDLITHTYQVLVIQVWDYLKVYLMFIFVNIPQILDNKLLHKLRSLQVKITKK